MIDISFNVENVHKQRIKHRDQITNANKSCTTVNRFIFSDGIVFCRLACTRVNKKSATRGFTS